MGIEALLLPDDKAQKKDPYAESINVDPVLRKYLSPPKRNSTKTYDLLGSDSNRYRTDTNTRESFYHQNLYGGRRISPKP